MPHNEDDLIQSRVKQLKAIATRRNDLLREMYHLIRHRDNVGSLLQVEEPNGEGEASEREQFLIKLDVNKHGEQGFITNHIGTLFEPLDDGEAAPSKSRQDSKERERSTSRTPNVSWVRLQALDSAVGAEESEDDHDELDRLGSTSDLNQPRSSPPREPQVEAPEASIRALANQVQVSGDNTSAPSQPSNDIEMEQEEPEPEGEVKAQTGEDATGQDKQAPVPIQESPTTVNPQAIFIPSTSSPSFQHTPRSSIVIPTPSEPALSLDRYNVGSPPKPEPKPTPTAPILHHRLKSDYPLPSLQILPPEFIRKKSTKRKKDRDRGDKAQKDDALPMGINRWTAMLNANPVFKRMSKSTKCLSSKDWSIAMTELRLIRTAERIETLKGQARWGLRQVKKQRGVGGLMKTHWDYLLDEMKWMRIDFREERKWKLALAYRLSTAILEWHALSSWEERVEHGVCVKWKPIPLTQMPTNPSASEGMGVDPASEDEMEANLLPSSSLLGLDYGSDTEDGDKDEKKPDDVTDQLQPTAMINDAMDTADEMREQEYEQAAAEQTPVIQLKTEEVDNAPALRSPTGVDTVSNDLIQKALKSASNDPLLGSKSTSQSLNGDADDKPPSKTKPSAYAPIREKLVYGSTNKLFFVTEDLHSFMPQGMDDVDLVALDFVNIFPDLQPLSLLDVAPPATEGKKKSSRGERDDPNKRMEETNYTKVYPTGQFMYSKPTLLGPLQPAKRWKDGAWLPMEEFPITPETEPSSYMKNIDESVSDLFDMKVKSGPIAQLPRDARRTKVDQYWSSSDDLLLKSLVDKYPGNWNLISECFNGCRKTTPSDRRTAVDCQDRWKAKWGSELQTKDNSQVNAEETSGAVQVASSSDAPASAVVSGPSTRNKRLASVSSQTAPTIAAGSEPKKRRRHLLLQETIRKTNRKRTEQQQKLLANQRKTQGMHETHAPLMKLPKRNPSELSRIKAEKDAQILADLQRARQRVDEAKGLPRLNGIPIPPAPQPRQQTPVQAAHGGQPQPTTQQVAQQLQLLQQAQAAQAAQASQANRAGNAAPANARVGNIARMSTPGAAGVAGTPRFTTQQMMQLQQRIAAGQQANSNGAAGQVPGGQTPTQYANRDATASPATHGMNSPHVTPGAVAAGTNSAQTQASQHAVSANQTASAPGASAATAGAAVRPGTQFQLFGANGANLAVANYNAEQLNAMRIHLLTQLGQHPQATAGGVHHQQQPHAQGPPQG